ncbi:MAG TPA: YceI family protein [Acidimicrobiales bacterium]|jgi:polyisoprenoid-binding protein YceI
MTTLPAPGVYTVDPTHSNLDFIARHMVASKVRGNFTEFTGTITIGDSVESSSVEAVAQAASITTNNEMRDGHLKSADFLEQETYPTLTFKSTKITPKGGDDYEMVADLTVKDVTKSVTFDLEYLGTNPSMQPGVTIVGFEAKAEIDRRDFNVNFNAIIENGGGLVVSNKIVIQLTIEASKQD